MKRPEWLDKLITAFWEGFYSEFNQCIAEVYESHGITPQRRRPQEIVVEVLPPIIEKDDRSNRLF